MELAHEIGDYSSEVQTYAEEIINTITHATGLMLSIPATVLLVGMARLHGTRWHVTACALYGLTLILMYSCSVLYHGSGLHELTKDSQSFLRDLDHCAIYFLIAGTYTPLCLINVIYDNLYAQKAAGRKPAYDVKIGAIVLTLVWLICIVGVSSKLINGSEGVNPILSYGSYLVMGWLVVLVARPMLGSLPRTGLRLLLAGGFSYTVGVIFLLSDTMPFNHPVWHLFVSAGTILHYFSIIACSIPIGSSPWEAMEKRTRFVILEWSTRFATANLKG